MEELKAKKTPESRPSMTFSTLKRKLLNYLACFSKQDEQKKGGGVANKGFKIL